VSPRLGTPRLHLRETDSTNDRARALAVRGAPHGTLVTAGAQTAGRGRQGRTWTAPAGRALLMSLVLRGWPPLLPLAAAIAVADVAGAGAGGAEITIKWPNDVLLGRGKLAGILVEARPQDGWAVLGIGMNVAVRRDDLPEELRECAAVLALEPTAIEPTLAALLDALDARLALEPPALLDAFRARDALLGRRVRWQRGEGTAAGVDAAGRLLVDRPGGEQVALDAGEVHLARGP
jgi:BirA family transcriptional regulator, biotin operon repressor / biotin---[acetyl-CoA-carboxylase] ligase